MPYLYGSSVQGIQAFLFATNRLREIVGASELVEQLCTTTFDDFLKDLGIEEGDIGEGIQKILTAAGNIRLVCRDDDAVRAIVRAWPKRAMGHAPGVRVSQAVVSYTGPLTKATMNQLEDKLKTQRNRPLPPAFPAWMAMERSRRTGAPAVDRNKEGELRDDATRKKEKAGAKEGPATLMKKLIPDGADRGVGRIPFDMADITGNRESSWIAVIHADGNSLGKKIQGMADKLAGADEDKLLSVYRDFSIALDKATCQAARDAFGQAVPTSPAVAAGDKNNWKHPLRPVVLGGDDLTVICRADFALEFTRDFLIAFQKRTKTTLEPLIEKFGLSTFENGLTACAGISFVKETYPFHYAIDLAESLCSYAKKKAKQIDETNVPACVAFHKVQSSFVTDYNDIVQRELILGTGVRFDCGPYYVEDGQGQSSSPKLSELLSFARELCNSNALKSGLRQWLGVLYRSKPEADQILKRLQQIHGKPEGWPAQVFPKDNQETPSAASTEQPQETWLSPVYDWMTVASLKGE